MLDELSNQALSTILGLIINVILARALGTGGYGIYAYVMAWIGLLQIPASLGLPSLITRQVAVYHERKQWALLRGLLLRSNQAVLAVSLSLAAWAAILCIVHADAFSDPRTLRTFIVALPLLPLVALRAARCAALRGLHKVVLGQLPELLLAPLLTLVMIGAVYVIGDYDLTPPLVVALRLVAAATSFLVGLFWLLRNLPQQVRRAEPIFETPAWARSAAPFLIFVGLQALNTQSGLIILGWMGSASEVALLRIATLASGLISFGYIAANAVLTPAIARLHATGERERMQHLITKSTRIVLAFSVPAGAILIIFGRDILAGFFGPDFASAELALAVLAVGQLINAATGPAGPILNMTGFERDTTLITLVAAVVAVVLSFALIPTWGVEGAAFAAAGSFASWNLLLSIQVYRRLGLHTTAFGLLGRLPLFSK